MCAIDTKARHTSWFTVGLTHSKSVLRFFQVSVKLDIKYLINFQKLSKL
nr:MAG TPA: hypothetical protein [Crassvirales sp.]